MTGRPLLPYLNRLENVLERTLHLKSKEGSQFAAGILKNMVRSLTVIQPEEYKAVPGGYDRPASDYLPIRVRSESVLA